MANRFTPDLGPVHLGYRWPRLKLFVIAAITSPARLGRMLDIARLRGEVEFKAVRSRGPGGQNVNKVSSAAVMYWAFEHTALLREDQVARVRQKLANIINAEGYLYLRSDEFRDLERNKSRCLEKLVALVADALYVAKKRRATKPTKGSKRRNRESKSRRSETKRLRRSVSHD